VPRRGVLPPRRRLTPRDVRRARDAYDDCLIALDAQLGAIIEVLRSRGVLDRTILIVTSDHGEQFGEHGSFGHGLSLFDEEARIPLLIRVPGLAPAGRVVAEEASLRDLAATAGPLRRHVAVAPRPLPGKAVGRPDRRGFARLLRVARARRRALRPARHQ
jgi:arylsulfatase A-like enzyme